MGLVNEAWTGMKGDDIAAKLLEVGQAELVNLLFPIVQSNSGACTFKSPISTSDSALPALRIQASATGFPESPAHSGSTGHRLPVRRPLDKSPTRGASTQCRGSMSLAW
jgi:hypothetical protein